MNSLSVVIITRNEEHNIADCIRSAKLVSDDIIVVDCGSSDQTVAIATNNGARGFVIDWKGYGFSKNFGAAEARNNWILSLDADERISKKLASSINRLNLTDGNHLFKFKRRNFIEEKEIRFGTLGFETIERIYHKEYCRWNFAAVHEKLVARQPVKRVISGSLLHFGLGNFEEHKQKAKLYARLSAEKYFSQGRPTHLLQGVASALFNSLKSYIFLLGFIEGRQGFLLAKTIAYYSWLKYFYLDQLLKESHTRGPRLIQNQSVRLEPVSN